MPEVVFLNVVVFGAGYVGLVTGAVMAYIGHEVTLVERKRPVVDVVNAGGSPIYEPGLESLIADAVSCGTLRATDDPHAVNRADVIFIAVGTPPLASGAPDLSAVEAAARSIGAHLTTNTQRPVIINKATVPMGATHLVEVWVTEELRSPDLWGGSYAVASNPEFLREGTAVSDTLYPDRIVIGSPWEWARERLLTLYRPIITGTFHHPAGVPIPRATRPDPVPVVMVDSVSSEMIKYAANAFLAMKVSFANEVARLCELVGADVTAVMAGIGADSRIGEQFLRAGVGWGGSCFGKDIAALLYTGNEYGYKPALLYATQEVNEAQRRHMVEHVRDLLRPVKGRHVAVWGLSFKPGTDDVRDAPARSVIAQLLALGLRVSAFDPVAMDNFRLSYPDLAIRYESDPLRCLKGADALMILTEWPQFKKVDLREIVRHLGRPLLIDGRNIIDPDAARRVGLLYRGIGRPDAHLSLAVERP